MSGRDGGVRAFVRTCFDNKAEERRSDNATVSGKNFFPQIFILFQVLSLNCCISYF